MFFRAERSKYRSGILQIFQAIVLAIFLVSCSSSGGSQSQGGEVKINLIADQDINPNDNGLPAPLSVFIYNVKDVGVFSSADLFDILNGSKSLQSASSKIYETILQPGGSQQIFITPDDDTKTLGFIGAYRDFNGRVCLTTWELPGKKRTWWRRIFSNVSLELNAHFHKTAMTIKKVD